jgi:feruloyl esterase
VNYYERLAARAGGYVEAQEFARFYLAPGVDHCTVAGPTGINPPIPSGRAERTELEDGAVPELMEALQAWVEGGVAPDEIAATSAPGVTPVRSRPWCLYPKRLTYLGGDVNTGDFGCD